MLELQKITIDDKEMFDRFLKRKCSRNSEFTFTNLFMWRKSYDICYLILDDMLCIMPQHKGSAPKYAYHIIAFYYSHKMVDKLYPLSLNPKNNPPGNKFIIQYRNSFVNNFILHFFYR